MSKPLPLYKCHKIVGALQIHAASITRQNKVFITPVETGFPAFEVPMAFYDKHKPKAGGYYVQYEDGYASYSPADAFERGYALLPDAEQPAYTDPAPASEPEPEAEAEAEAETADEVTQEPDAEEPEAEAVEEFEIPEEPEATEEVTPDPAEEAPETEPEDNSPEGDEPDAAA